MATAALPVKPTRSLLTTIKGDAQKHDNFEANICYVNVGTWDFVTLAA